MKKMDIAKMKTIARVETNILKLEYGSGRRGVGYLDSFSGLKTVRGAFTQFTGKRALSGGDVVPVQKYRFITRFDLEISNNLDNQMRFVIANKIYTVDSWKVDEQDRETYFIFELLPFGK